MLNKKEQYLLMIRKINNKNKENLLYNVKYIRKHLKQKPKVKYLTNEEQSLLYNKQEKHKNDNIIFFNTILNQNRDYISEIRKQMTLIRLKQKEIDVNDKKMTLHSYCFIHEYDFVLIEDMLKSIEDLIEDTKKNYSLFKNKKNIIEIGKQGENIINNYLNIYDYNLTNHSNVLFEVSNDDTTNTAESDNIVVSSNGVFTLEVKNLGTTGKYQLLIEKDGRWIKIYEDGKRQTMLNVTNQTYRHIAFNEKIINENLKKYGINKFINIYPIIVIANEEVDIINCSSLPIVRPSNVYHQITLRNDNLTNHEIETINKIIDDNKRKDLNYPMIQYYEVFLYDMKLLININKILKLMLDENKEVILTIDELSKINDINRIKGKRDYFYEIYKQFPNE